MPKEFSPAAAIMCFNGASRLKGESVMLWILMGFGLLVGGAIMYAGWKLIRNLE